MKSYAEFRQAIRERESGGRYDCVNSLGYLGAYQFGLARLCDLGLTRRKVRGSKGVANSLFEFIEPDGREVFLRSSTVQDACFDVHVQMLAKRCRAICPDNLSGAIAACHLLGVGGLVNFVRNGIDESDGFGTKLSSYYELFRGYEISHLPAVRKAA